MSFSPFELLYGSEPVVVESQYTVAESVRRLRDAVDDGARGSVSIQQVSIHCARTLSRNNYGPRFTGEFKMEQGRVFLVGSFSRSESTKVLISLWLGVAAVGTVGLCFLAATGEVEPETPLFGVATFVLGWLLIYLGNLIGRSDIDSMTRLIHAALQT